MFNKYLLEKLASYSHTKWRRFCRIRDGKKCVLCNCSDTSRLEVHHCYPKSQYPDYQYALWNGVTLCYGCHRITVHACNTFQLTNWQKFMPLWVEYRNREEIRKFNESFQERVYV